MTKKIGGFFGLHPREGSTSHSVAALWNLDNAWAFANGRSALHYLLEHLKPTRFWLPAYCCNSLAEAAQGLNLQYYPLRDLSPDCDFLSQHLQKGDAVLAIDYFGRNPDAAFLELCKSKRDVHWIEDRAQALHPALHAWGDYVLYSPRKLLGVADGGIVTGEKVIVPQMRYESAIEPDDSHPAVMRAHDTTEANNAEWYAAYVATENAMKVSRHAMSTVSKRILETADATSIMAKRKANYAILMQALGDIALLPRDALDFIPLGFPVQLKNRQQVAAALHKQDIFAAHHWPELPSPGSFKAEHELAASLLTLPCDHRYDASDMQCVIDAVKGAL